MGTRIEHVGQPVPRRGRKGEEGEGLHLRGCPGNEVNMASKREGDSILHGKGERLQVYPHGEQRQRTRVGRVVGRR